MSSFRQTLTKPCQNNHKLANFREASENERFQQISRGKCHTVVPVLLTDLTSGGANNP